MPVPEPIPEPTVRADGLPNWTVLIGKLNVRGLVKQLAQQSELLSMDETSVELRCESRALATNAMALAGMEKALAEYFVDAPKTLKIHVGSVQATPAKVQAHVKQVALEGAQAIVDQDATIQTLIREFDGMVLPSSIKAI